MAKSPTPDPIAEKEALTTGRPADDYKTEQEKGGRDPVDPPVEPVKAQPLDIAPNEPYPTGNPPDPRAPQSTGPNEGAQPVKSGDT